MGKKARLKKQAKVLQAVAERQNIEIRRRQARSPMVRLATRVVLALVVTVVILYVGQIINQRIAQAGNSSVEVSK